MCSPSSNQITTMPALFYQPWNSYYAQLSNSTDRATLPYPTFESPQSGSEGDLSSSINSQTGVASPVPFNMSPSSFKPSTTPSPGTDSGNSSGCFSDTSPIQTNRSSPILKPSCSNETKTPSPDIGVAKKNTRTNYSPQQIRSLERIFLDTPYPESEVMEQLSRDMDIPEKNLKVNQSLYFIIPKFMKLL